MTFRAEYNYMFRMQSQSGYIRLKRKIYSSLCLRQKNLSDLFIQFDYLHHIKTTIQMSGGCSTTDKITIDQ